MSYQHLGQRTRPLLRSPHRPQYTSTKPTSGTTATPSRYRPVSRNHVDMMPPFYRTANQRPVLTTESTEDTEQSEHEPIGPGGRPQRVVSIIKRVFSRQVTSVVQPMGRPAGACRSVSACLVAVIFKLSVVRNGSWIGGGSDVATRGS